MWVVVDSISLARVWSSTDRDKALQWAKDASYNVRETGGGNYGKLYVVKVESLK